MSTALVIFGYYPALPLAIRNHGRQPTFTGGHAMALLPDGPKPSVPFVSEFDHESGPITGCTESSAAMDAHWATGGRIVASWQAREALQDAIVVDRAGTNAQLVGVTPSELQAGIAKLWALPTSLTTDWLTISQVGAYGWLGDPLASDWLRVLVADLRAFCSGKDRIISAFGSVVFTRSESPDTATEDPMANVLPFGPARVHVSGINVFTEPRLSLTPVAQGGPFLYQTGDTDVTVIGKAIGDAYQGDTTWLCYLSAKGGPIFFPKASAGTITPLTPGGITQAEYDAAVRAARASGIHDAAAAAAAVK